MPICLEKLVHPFPCFCLLSSRVVLSLSSVSHKENHGAHPLCWLKVLFNPESQSGSFIVLTKFVLAWGNFMWVIKKNRECSLPSRFHIYPEILALDQRGQVFWFSCRRARACQTALCRDQAEVWRCETQDTECTYITFTRHGHQTWVT